MSEDLPSSPPRSFASFAARPPTPPRDTDKEIEDAARFLGGETEIEPLSTARQTAANYMDTPPSSSPLRSNTLDAVNGSIKRVDFLAHPTIVVQSNSNHDLSASTPLSGPLPARGLRPIKSILKSTASALPTPDEQEQKFSYFASDDAKDFPRMLNSVIQALQSKSRHQHLDVYQALNSTLAMYENLPHLDDIRRNLTTLEPLILRDMTMKHPATSDDINITVQAVKLTARLLADEGTVESISHEFQSSVLEQSIAALSQAACHKQIMKTHLGLLAEQRLASAVLTASRTEKLAIVLHTIEQRCSGNAAIATRLTIYCRLMERHPGAMTKSMPVWLQHALHGLLSDHNDTRSRAFHLTERVSAVYGNSTTAVTALHALFDSEPQKGTTYFQFYAKRMAELLKNETTSEHVPRIWTSITQFHRHKRYRIYKWKYFKHWMQIIQSCLNNKDATLRAHAHFAWRRLIYIVQPDGSTPEPIWTLLKTPIRSGIAKIGSDDVSRQLRRLALDSYYILLHYAFRPSLSHAELDSAWKLAAHKFLSDMIEAGSKGRNTGCRILLGLLTPNAGVWNIDAALLTPTICPSDLPRMDPRWVRSRIGQVIELLEAILRGALGSDEESYQLAQQVWLVLLKTIIDAGSQEVKMSKDHKQAMVSVLACVGRVWTGLCNESRSNTHSDSNSRRKTPSVAYTRCDDILRTSYAELGLDKIADNCIPLSLLDKAATSDSDSAEHTGPEVSPATFVLLFRSQEPQHFRVATGSSHAISVLLESGTRLKADEASKLAYLLQAFDNASSLLRTDQDLDRLSLVWAQITIKSIGLLRNEIDSNTTGPRSLAVGAQVRKLLRDGLKLTNGKYDISLPLVQLFEITVDLGLFSVSAGKPDTYHALLASVCSELLASRKQAGDGRLTSFATAVDSLLQMHNSRNTHGMSDHHQQDCVPSEAAVLMSLMRLAKHTSGEVYKAISQGELMVDPLELLDHLTNTMMRLQEHDLEEALPNFHSCISVWVQDLQQNAAKEEVAHLSQALPDIWSRWLGFAAQVHNVKQHMTPAIDTMLVAGLESILPQIVKITADFWNRHFGTSRVLKCSSALRNILRQPLSDANVVLPSSWSRVPSNSSSDGEVELDIGREEVTTSGLNALEVANQEGEAVTKTNVSRPAHGDSQVDFVAIPAPVPSAESQHLTENQRAVRSRQHDRIRLYPDLSSSPLAIPLSSPSRAQQMISSDIALEILDEPHTPTKQGHSAAATEVVRAEEEEDDDADADLAASQLRLEAEMAEQRSQEESFEEPRGNTVSSDAADEQSSARSARRQRRAKKGSQNTGQCSRASVAGEREPVEKTASSPVHAELQSRPGNEEDVNNEPSLPDLIDRETSQPSSNDEQDSQTVRRSSRKRKQRQEQIPKSNKKQKQSAPTIDTPDKNEHGEIEEELVIVSCQPLRGPTQLNSATSDNHSNAETLASAEVQSSPSSRKMRRKERRRRKHQHVDKDKAGQSSGVTAQQASADEVAMVDALVSIPARPVDPLDQASAVVSLGNAAANDVVMADEVVAENITAAPVAESITADAGHASVKGASAVMALLKEATKICQDLVLTPSQERRLDDMMFALRQKSFEAGRRGRELSQSSD